RTLTIGLLKEPTTIEGFTGGGFVGGAQILRNFVHDHLVEQDDRGTPYPQLATEIPTLENGAWVVNDDATMDITWRLKDGVKWHDGTPFNSADLMFAFTLHKDPDLLDSYPAERASMQSAAAPDPLTFAVHWSSIVV